MGAIKVGDPAPDFELRGTDGRTHRLAAYRGGWVVLALYPGDFTLVCTRQLCSYRDSNATLQALDATVLGISPQDLDSHERFVAEHGLTIPLLADPDREAIRAFGVAGPGGLVRRAIFIVDPSGIVRYRHVALFGLRYHDAARIREALETARAA